MESRKRPYSDEEDTAAAKKRILTGPNGGPHVNGVDSPEPTENDSLELFRKEAIFRRMRHYAREHERSQHRIAELERRRHTCEAGLAAMSACWNQLVETIRLLVQPEDAPEVKIDMFDFALRVHDDPNLDFTKTLQDNMNVTKTLVKRLVKAGGNEQRMLSSSVAFKQSEQAATECIALRSEVDFIRAQLRNLEEEKEQIHSALLGAENRLDRSKSRTVLEMQARVEATRPAESGTEESQRKTSSPSETPPKSPLPSNGDHDPTELEILREQIANRDLKIVELEKEAALLRDERTILESEFRVTPLEFLAENPHYKALLGHASFLQATVTETRSQVTRLTDDVAQLRASRKEWEDGVIAATNHANQEYKTMLAKRDTENARLRDQREQHNAEITERKQKDSVKLSSLQEFKALADSRSERILVLESELRRYKAQLAANANQEDLMTFFMKGNLEEVSYLRSLQARIDALETRNVALEQTFSIFQEDHPDVVQHMKAEADALQRLAELETQLKEYKSVYGNLSTLPLDVSQLSGQLKQKEDELQRLRLLDIQRAQAETSLYSELDKLSAAWEALDRQVKSKVFDLSAMEDRLTKVGLDKAKCDNKYFAAMREKEAIETERKNLARNVEKQVKVIERLVDAEKNLTNQLNAAEKEMAHLKSIGNTYKDRVDLLRDEVNTWIHRAEGEKKRALEIRARFSDREKVLETKKAELQKVEDNMIRARKELESKHKDAPPPQDSGGTSEQDHLYRLLKCSCRIGFRNTVLTKCLHTFCKDCIDKRIATRQRKCPACGLAFSQGDVLSGMFFQ